MLYMLPEEEIYYTSAPGCTKNRRWNNLSGLTKCGHVGTLVRNAAAEPIFRVSRLEVGVHLGSGSLFVLRVLVSNRISRGVLSAKFHLRHSSTLAMTSPV